MITKKELSNALNISISTIDRYMKKGMPFTRKGFRICLFDLDLCKKWIFKEYNL